MINVKLFLDNDCQVNYKSEHLPKVGEVIKFAPDYEFIIVSVEYVVREKSELYGDSAKEINALVECEGSQIIKYEWSEDERDKLNSDILKRIPSFTAEGLKKCLLNEKGVGTKLSLAGLVTCCRKGKDRVVLELLDYTGLVNIMHDGCEADEIESYCKEGPVIVKAVIYRRPDETILVKAENIEIINETKKSKFEDVHIYTS
jgi:hypothetical protein